MQFHFLVLMILSLIPTTDFDSGNISKSSFEHANSVPSDRISVRESNTELQVTVGERIFVFGKAKGTLEKVKVGMHVLQFSQVPNNEGNQSTFTDVNWKKLKDGSIQIQSSYRPWPLVLRWTVLANWQLKMEASAPPVDFSDFGWLGLGFNYPDQMLYQVSWNSARAGFGQWKNHNFTPMASPEIAIQSEDSGFFQPFQTVKLEFESVSIDVRTELPGIFLSLGQSHYRNTALPFLKSDLAFVFNQPKIETAYDPQTPSALGSAERAVSSSPLVLWFQFQ
jgi:hypothetical protein